jgi:hypothetical protein
MVKVVLKRSIRNINSVKIVIKNTNYTEPNRKREKRLAAVIKHSPSRDF